MKASDIAKGKAGAVRAMGSPQITPFINPLRSEAAERFVRTLDSLPLAGSGGGGGGGFDGNWPLKLVKVDASNVQVLLGSISGFTPTNIATNIDVSGTDGTWTFFMHATLSGTSVTAVEVANDGAATGPGSGVPADDATNSYRLIGTVVVAGGVITAVSASMAWSQNVTICTAETPPYYWTTGA